MARRSVLPFRSPLDYDPEQNQMRNVERRCRPLTVGRAAKERLQIKANELQTAVLLVTVRFI
jgi:hypothetical protein